MLVLLVEGAAVRRFGFARPEPCKLATVDPARRIVEIAIATNSSSKIPNPFSDFLLLGMIILTGSGKENRH